MNLEIGFSYPNYLAHITITVGKYCLWLNIVSTNWKSISYRKDFRTSRMGCFSVFTFALTQ